MENKLWFSVLGSSSATADFYVPVPYACIIKTVQAAASADPGDAETITVAKASTTVGVLTYGSTIAAGALGTYAADSTGGETAFAAGDVVKLTISQLTAAATFVGYITVDPFVMTVQ